MKIKLPLPDLKTQKEIIKQEESGLFDGLRLETRLKYDEGWKQPTPGEVRLMYKKLDLTGSQVGNLVGVNSRTPRKWTADIVQNPKSSQKIPYAAWRLLVLELEKK